MRQIREALGAIRVDPNLLTSVERRHLEGAKRRDEAYAKRLRFAWTSFPSHPNVRT